MKKKEENFNIRKKYKKFIEKRNPKNSIHKPLKGRINLTNFRFIQIHINK